LDPTERCGVSPDLLEVPACHQHKQYRRYISETSLGIFT
jgi:hypothetical protein